MRTAFLLTLALLVSCAPAASAQGGLNLFVDHCGADGGLTRALFDCNSNAGNSVFIASIVIPADMPQFAATSAIFDVMIAAGTLPPWWQVGTGQCRANAVVASYDPTTFPPSDNCPSIWGEIVPLQVQRIEVGIYGPGSFRLNSGAAVPVGSERSLVADGTDRVVCRVIVQHAKTTGASACEGCRVGACILLNQMKLQQPAGVGDYTVTYPNWNFIVGHNADGYLSSNGPDCTTPALNRTWGAIKSMYR